MTALENMTPIVLSHESVGRVITGLGWDPNPNPGLKGSAQHLLGQYAETDFDLDMSCYIYDGDAHCIDIVTGERGNLVDSSGCIRHDGDERDGRTTGDDEAIEIDLMALPPAITHIVMLCEVASAHSFGDIHNPRARVADYGTDDNFLHAMLGEDEARDNSACVFGCLQRFEADNWQARQILYYLDRETIEGDWPAYLAGFIG